MAESLYTYESLADFLGFKPQTVRRMVSRREIPFLKVGGKAVRFQASAIERWLDEKRVEPVRKRGK